MRPFRVSIKVVDDYQIALLEKTVEVKGVNGEWVSYPLSNGRCRSNIELLTILYLGEPMKELSGDEWKKLTEISQEEEI